MSSKLSDKKLEEIRRIHKEASPAPFYHKRIVPDATENGELHDQITDASGNLVCMDLQRIMSEENFLVFWQGRNYLGPLIKEVDRLRAENEALKARLTSEEKNRAFTDYPAPEA